MPSPGWNNGWRLGRGVDPITLGMTTMARPTIAAHFDPARDPATPVRATPQKSPEPLAGLTRGALMRLPDHERDVLLLRVFHGQSCAAIARRLGQPESAIRRRQLEALRHLRQLTERDSSAAS